MGEDQVLATAVDVDLVAERATNHRRALDVPAWPALAPRAIPGRLAGLGRLPQGEVVRLLLMLAGLNPRAGRQPVDGVAAELAVLRKALHSIVDVALRLVGVAIPNQLLDDFDHLGDEARGVRRFRRTEHIQRVHAGPVGLDVAFCGLLWRDPIPVAGFDDLVVHIGEVLDVLDRVAGELQVTAHHVDADEQPGVADVRMVLGCEAADVHRNRLSGGLKGLLAAG